MNPNSNSSNIINQNEDSNNTNSNVIASASSQSSDKNTIQGNGSDVGRDSPKASEIIKHTPAKQINAINTGIIIFVVIAVIAFAVGYRRKKQD